MKPGEILSLTTVKVLWYLVQLLTIALVIVWNIFSNKWTKSALVRNIEIYNNHSNYNHKAWGASGHLQTKNNSVIITRVH